MPKKVFISYAQVPEAHKLRVAELVVALRAAGLSVLFDQDVTSPQGPPEGWPQWMLDQIDQADWVLVVCNEAYYRRFRGREEPGRGLGARWEGAIIGQALYNEGMLNRKFIPVLLGDDEKTAYIPEPLQGATYYRLPADLPKLTNALTGNSPPQGAASPSSKKKKNPTATVTRPRARQSAGWPEIAPYALLSLGSFLGALVLVGLLLWKADLLARLGLTGSIYYIVLLPLGLAVAGFLFGAMRSFARYRGRHLGGVLEFGGPIVGFALVVLGGFLLPPPASNFPLTVYVYGQAGPQDLILRSQGAVLLDLGSERRREPIGGKGQAFFPEIPASFRGQAVNVGLDAEGYELANSVSKLSLTGTNLYLPVRKKPGRFKGHVQDEQGGPVEGASVTVAGFPAIANKYGNFELTVPPESLQDELPLRVLANGYNPWNGTAVPRGSEITVILTHKR